MSQSSNNSSPTVCQAPCWSPRPKCKADNEGPCPTELTERKQVTQSSVITTRAGSTEVELNPYVEKGQQELLAEVTAELGPKGGGQGPGRVFLAEETAWAK